MFASCHSSLGGHPFPHQPTTLNPGDNLSPSLDVYKGKIFVLVSYHFRPSAQINVLNFFVQGRQAIRVGTLLSWADRILSFVQRGDFLRAIDTARSYYVGEAPGNKAGLPEDPKAMREVVGQKIRELMLASARYAFSEDRMTDDTHRSADGRGVDRTSLFERLVSTTATACLALDDLEFLFEDLYEMYQSNGISGIYLVQLQSFLLNGDIRIVPPRIAQQLIAFHNDRGDFEMAERIIWHIDPNCLDVNQAIRLCQAHDLYDALIYVYNRALRDFVSPVVEFLSLIRKVQQLRKERPSRIEDPAQPDWSRGSSPLLEILVPNAYKIYPYLGDVLSGLTHPSQEPMPDDEALQAKSDVYLFLFLGRSSVWQGKLILTSDEEGGPEPTYPYLRLLIRFDAEALLHALDLAFEDSYLNDPDQDMNRQQIIDALNELVGAEDLTSNDATFLRIFIARNVPKYPQFIRFTPRDIRSTLRGLADDSDQSTREDRQLAAESFLSIFSLRDEEELLQRFELAGFYRILRAWNQQEKRWAPLITTFLQDPDITSDEIFAGITETLVSSSLRTDKVPDDVSTIVVEALPSLLSINLSQSASLLDRFFPHLHDPAVETLRRTGPSKEFFYLRCLIQPNLIQEEEDSESPPKHPTTPSNSVSPPLRTRYITLMCENEPHDVLATLESLTSKYFDLEDIVSACEDGKVYDAQIWAIDQSGELPLVFESIDSINGTEAVQLARTLSGADVEEDDEQLRLAVDPILERLSALGRMAIRICREHSSDVKLPGISSPDEMWFRLLSSQIRVVQEVSSVVESSRPGPPTMSIGRVEVTPLERLRLLVQETFTSLVQQTSSQDLSFSQLFKRLVDASSSGPFARKSSYNEFRLILGGMLDSYRSEGDFLIITNRLVERDLFETMQQFTAARKKGRRMHLS